MKIYFNQQAGLGDIFYLQKAASFFPDDEIVWPVIEQYSFVKDYIQSENINFCLLSDLSDTERNLFENQNVVKEEDFLYLPFNKACQNYGNCSSPIFMRAKYDWLRQSFENWQNYININRNLTREKACKEYFGINDDDEFVFVNDTFASPPEIIYRDMNISSDKKIVKISPENFEKFNPFDYIWLIERAKEIHVVDSVFCYFVEVFNTQADLFCYSRILEDGSLQYPSFNHIDYIHTKNWNYIL